MTKWIDEIMSEKSKLTTRQLRIKLEITRLKIKEMKARKKAKKCDAQQRTDEHFVRKSDD